MPTANAQLASAEQQAFLNDLDTRLWKAADKLRQQLDAANYKHIVLGYIFLKYISDSFTAFQAELKAQLQNPKSDYYLDPADYPSDYFEALQTELETRDYYTAAHIFWVPPAARWENINNAAHLNIGDPLPWDDTQTFKGVANLIDNAFAAIERENAPLKGIIQRISGYQVSEPTLIGLIDLFSDTNFTKPTHDGKPINLAAKDILGHVYEYFLGQFALAEGKKGGQYFTPKSIVSLIVEMLQPFTGRIYDPAMGSGGFFVQTERFIHAHQGNIDNVTIYGQEYNPTTWKLAAMNMAIRGIAFDFGKSNADSFTNPQHIDAKMDVIMANPPFNMSDWWSENLANDPRWAYGIPPQGNANFAWLQHMLYHLNPTGRMALLLANGSMSSQSGGEGSIRQKLIEADLVECMVALPGQLFINTQIPACIWILNKAKRQKGQVLFLDARQIGYMKDRTLRDFTPDDIAHLADTYHAWQRGKGYENQAGFCYAATLEEIQANDFVLTPDRYVGSAEVEDDGIPFADKMRELTALLNQQFSQGQQLEAQIRHNLAVFSGSLNDSDGIDAV
ncbi:class I SAM-dependent DNA methyltransferase [Spirabiliibacterium falconis]|uniref:class I SAM-dependent DNA methyltransferase n=1 Tax=Spirabiliibacterium falconis TaxID=572023 RepID=UPI001AAD0B62|nr:class I SAM-dependent DNA methyltransferase [Spirabiliibacterium falconis]MBE2893506.1 type I restriction-modification system subunit M [Spirabiliibacterium falconis]